MNKLLVSIALALLAGGCSTKGYVRAEAIADTVKSIRMRHDAYVTADATLTNAQKVTDLRDTDLLERLLVEAQGAQPEAPK